MDEEKRERISKMSIVGILFSGLFFDFKFPYSP